MQRRSFLNLLGTMVVAGTQAGSATELDFLSAWSSWKARFLRPEGRVVDPEQSGVSHSEGQAYALLLSQAAGDRVAFDRIEAWTRAHLLVREDALMAWRWTPDAGVIGTDWHNATDGDLFRAWALLRAARDSDWDVAAERFKEIAKDLSASCLRPDPRAADELLLLPGAEAYATDQRVLINPSYIMPRALRELAEATDDNRLMRTADHGETCIAELAARGSLPDWIDVTADGYDAPTHHDLRSAYDALRIPLYLIWSGRGDHPAVRLAQRQLSREEESPRVVVSRDKAGRIVRTSDLPGYFALAQLVACEPPVSIALPADGPYYPAVLHLLTELARRESGHCRAPK